MRFPDFKDYWEEITLGTCSDSIDYGMNASACEFDGINKYIRITDIDENSSRYKSESPVSPTGVLVDKYLVEENDILFARTGASTGKTYLYNAKDGKLYFAGFLIRAKIKKTYNSYFIFTQTQTLAYNKWVKVMSMRSGQPGINSQEYASYSFYIPSRLEQEKIASLLLLIDDRIHTQNEIIQRYKSLMKGLSQKLFTQKLKFEDEKSVKDGIWDKRKLGDLTFKVGKKNKENLLYPIYSINNKEGFLPQNQQFDGMDSNERGYDISLYKIIKSKTFAYNPARINVGSIGFSGEINDIIISSLYVCFKTNKELEDNYLLHYLDSYHFNRSVLRNVEGGVRQYLFYENFSTIKIPLPSVKEQKKIADFISSISKKIKLEMKLLEKYENQKKFLLQNMFI